MTAKEWLDIIKKAKDYNHELTPLIEKYGELCVKDFEENDTHAKGDIKICVCGNKIHDIEDSSICGNCGDNL